MSIEEGSSASGRKRGGIFDYMTMEEARREETMLKEELAKMKTKLESIESKITKYQSEILESNFISRLLSHSSTQTFLDYEKENKKSLESQIAEAEGKLSELQESMSKKARMYHQEGIVDTYSCIVVIVINLLYFILAFVMLSLLH